MIQHKHSKLFKEKNHYLKLIKQQVSSLEFYLLMYCIKLSIKSVLSNKLIKLNLIFDLKKKHILRLPESIVNHNDKALLVEETNALYFCLKRHILLKEIDSLKLKSTVKSYNSKLSKVHKVSSDDEF